MKNMGKIGKAVIGS